MKWYHGTGKENSEVIIKLGFSLNQDEVGIWGRGIYLTDSMEDAKGYGKFVLEVDVEMDEVLFFDYKDIQKIIPDLMVEEEAGDPEFESYVVGEKDKKAVVVVYSNSETHLIVYDTNLIKKVIMSAN